MEFNICIVGLGYVGLPLLLKLSRFFKVIGYDNDKKKIRFIKKKYKKIKVFNSLESIKNSNIYIIAVPTPIYKNKKPNLTLLKNATVEIAKFLNKKDIIIYESTVYPGTTEEICVPILENISQLKFNKDFFVGYSPERINPGDKKHTIENTVKIISASNKNTLKILNRIYSAIVFAGIHKVSNIKTAESVKIIENVQRDINIGIINEFSKIFRALNLDTYEILKAASTKWNFINLKPGLVGGHCISVDPYYLLHKSKKVGQNALLIESARKINESMTNHVVSNLKSISKLKKINLIKSNVLFLGGTFKENCDDFRNSKSLELVMEIKKIVKNIIVIDPFYKSIKHKFINISNKVPKIKFDILIVSVPHDEFLKNGESYYLKNLKKINIYFDLVNSFKSKSDFKF